MRGDDQHHMNLTLALGLKYEPPQRTEFLPSRQEGAPSDFKQAMPSTDTALKSSPVIDVKPIENKHPSPKPSDKKDYDYLAYNMRATLDIIHAVGTQLHITI